MIMQLEQLAQHLGATLYLPAGTRIDTSRTITDISPLDKAGDTHVSFILHQKYLPAAVASQAYALITATELPTIQKAQLIHPEPRLAMARAGNYFYQKTSVFYGQSPLAEVAETAKIAASASIFPFAYIGEGAHIAEHCCVYPQVYVGKGCEIGAGTILYPGAVIMDGCRIGAGVIVHPGAVIGADGFGYLNEPDGSILKIPQKGFVVIEDGVEVGAQSTVDRATFDATIIRRGTKLDSQVHVGHNVQIGENSLLCGQVGIAGSSKIGKNFVAAGQVGIAPGVEIPDNVTLGGKTGVTRSLTAAGKYLGMPAINPISWHKQSVALEKLPELVKKVAELELQLAAMQQRNAKE
jgi:UDP-3-O-[3-hydroxymyristoyl] glucosamine N-acyltransferase